MFYIPGDRIPPSCLVTLFLASAKIKLCLNLEEPRYLEKRRWAFLTVLSDQQKRIRNKYCEQYSVCCHHCACWWFCILIQDAKASTSRVSDGQAWVPHESVWHDNHNLGTICKHVDAWSKISATSLPKTRRICTVTEIFVFHRGDRFDNGFAIPLTIRHQIYIKFWHCCNEIN